MTRLLVIRPPSCLRHSSVQISCRYFWRVPHPPRADYKQRSANECLFTIGAQPHYFVERFNRNLDGDDNADSGQYRGLLPITYRDSITLTCHKASQTTSKLAGVDLNGEKAISITTGRIANHFRSGSVYPVVVEWPLVQRECMCLTYRFAWQRAIDK